MSEFGTRLVQLQTFSRLVLCCLCLPDMTDPGISHLKLPVQEPSCFCHPAQMTWKGGCSSKTMAWEMGDSLRLSSEQRDPIPCVPGIQVPGPAGTRHTCLPTDTGYVWSMSPLVGSCLCHKCFSHDLCWHQIPRRWAPTHHAWFKYQVPFTGITEAGELVFKRKTVETGGRGRSKVGGSLAPSPCSHGPSSSFSPYLLADTSPAQSQPSPLNSIVPTKRA